MVSMSGGIEIFHPVCALSGTDGVDVIDALSNYPEPSLILLSPMKMLSCSSVQLLQPVSVFAVHACAFSWSPPSSTLHVLWCTCVVAAKFMIMLLNVISRAHAWPYFLSTS